MDWHDELLAAAGAIGALVAIIHGVLLQRLMIAPLHERLAKGEPTPRLKVNLIGPILQFSTFGWLTGGVMLMLAAIALGPEAKLALGLLVGAHFLYGAVENFRATRGRHPGWMLMAAAVMLIGASLSGSG